MKYIGSLKTRSFTEALRFADLTSEITENGFWLAELEGLPSYVHQEIFSLFLMPNPSDNSDSLSS